MNESNKVHLIKKRNNSIEAFRNNEVIYVVSTENFCVYVCVCS